MKDRSDEPLSRDDAAFVRNVADLYAAAPMTASQRTRFDARLDERLRDRAARRRPWFALAAGAAAALSLFVWRTEIDTPLPTSDVAQSTVELDVDANTDEWILAMATDDPVDADATLPADYRAISGLLLGD